MSYMSFARSILNGSDITVFRTPDGAEMARDFTYIDDIVAGIAGALDAVGAPPPAGQPAAGSDSGGAGAGGNATIAGGGGGNAAAAAGTTGNATAVAAGGAEDDGYGGRARVYNLGNSAPSTVTQLLRSLESHLGRTARLNYAQAPRLGEVPRTWADVRAAARDLGYAPRTSLHEGLRRFTEWYVDYYGPGGIDGPGSRAAADERAYRPD
jgi:UDP-glucuronate 4-epimerase